MKRAAILFIFILCTKLAPAQETELFLSTQSGSPVRLNLDEDQVFWNYSIGIERSFIDRVSVGISWRKLFNFAGATNYSQTMDMNNSSGFYTITYNEDYKGSAFDFEAKYFFLDTEDGAYMSSNFSFQHVEMEVKMMDMSYYSSLPYYLNSFKSDFNLYPVGFKLGSRTSGDTFVWDFYLGVVKNLGHDNVKRPNELYLEYNHLNRYSFIIGLKAGVRL